MKKNKLYIYANETKSGLLFIALGVMEILKKNYPKVALFRPIVTQKEDYESYFLHSYFDLKQSSSTLYGVTLQEAKHIIATQGESALYTLLIEKFQSLVKEFDFVLVLGIDSSSFENIVDLDINVELAKNFACNILHIINGYNKEKVELEDSFLLYEEMFDKANLYRIATIFNKTPFEFSFERTFSIPYIDELAKLSTADIANALNQPINEVRPISDLKIVGLSLEHFLTQFSQDELLIFPADRGEIIAGIVASFYTKDAPKPSGIVFCYDIAPNEIFLKMLQPLQEASIALFYVKEDTFSIAKKLSQIKPKLHLSDKKKIDLALGVFHTYISSDFLQQYFLLEQNSIITPQMFSYQLFNLARGKKKKILLPEAHDKRILLAAQTILDQQIADIILLSSKENLQKRCDKWGIKLLDATVIDPKDENLKQQLAKEFYALRKHKGITQEEAYDAMDHINYFATMMVKLGLADGMVSGATHSTAETIRPALEIIKTKRQNQKVSSIFFMCLETKVLVFGDCAIIKEPSSNDLADIAKEAALNAKKFAIEPKVALISYSSGDSGSGESVEKVKQALTILQEQKVPFLVDGPMQFDAAFDKEVAKKKLPSSKVAGEASVFIFPDLNTANTTYKAVQRSSGAIAIGPVLQGLAKPINDLSRGCLVEDIINTIAITAIQAQEEE